MIGEKCSFECSSLVSMTFDGHSQLSHVEKWALAWRGLTAIQLHASLVVIYEKGFGQCSSRASIGFCAHSKLLRLHEQVFCGRD
jgi:hypothetical protein